MKPSAFPCSLLFGLLIASLANASPVSIQLPAETIALRSADMPGYTLATQKCGICHSADYVEFQPPGMDQSQWTSLVRKMRDAYKAPLEDSEIQSIGHYLSVAYAGPAGTQVAKETASDVDELLARNTCIGCHSIDQKIVGPAFKDIAKHYQTNKQAVATVAKHIAEGGSGRWGAIPMPPYPGLSETEREQLARYILAQ
ncbi:c-type cytochrome [Pseudomonas sp. NPDC090755]|uniref:c-type cytochrome n=1 Tax=Pseudomonas sp. NPDC090755 TaxID=3364481 RepID=UPI00383A5E14